MGNKATAIGATTKNNLQGKKVPHYIIKKRLYGKKKNH